MNLKRSKYGQASLSDPLPSTVHEAAGVPWRTGQKSAVREKFTQHDDLKQILFGTGDAKPVAHTAKDVYWGIGGDGTGKNMLGIILMQTRAELREVPGVFDNVPPLPI